MIHAQIGDKYIYKSTKYTETWMLDLSQFRTVTPICIDRDKQN